MRITESELRQIIREELANSQLASAENAPTSEIPQPQSDAADSHIRRTDRLDTTGQYIDLRPIQDDIMSLGNVASELYKKAQGSLVDDAVWAELQPQHRFSNAIVKAIRKEILMMTREMSMEDEKPWEW